MAKERETKAAPVYTLIDAINAMASSGDIQLFELGHDVARTRRIGKREFTIIKKGIGKTPVQCIRHINYFSYPPYLVEQEGIEHVVNFWVEQMYVAPPDEGFTADIFEGLEVTHTTTIDRLRQGNIEDYVFREENNVLYKGLYPDKEHITDRLKIRYVERYAIYNINHCKMHEQYTDIKGDLTGFMRTILILIKK